MASLMSSSLADTPSQSAGFSPVSTSLTPINEAGRCSMRGQCGSKSWFGKQLPCVDNGLAEDPDAETRKILVDLCGPKWSTGPSMSKAGKSMVTELDQLISHEYGSGFYDSCKDVKFGPSNSNAMDFIGGGAKNYSQLLKFLGDEKAVGSPFQINFPRPETYSEPNMAPLEDMKNPRKCNDEDPSFRCACVDCPQVCPALAPVKEAGSCHVGKLPCLSFASIITYSILIFSFFGIVFGRVAWKKHATRCTERHRLLQDTRTSDDEDDEDPFLRNSGFLDRPQRYHKINTWCDSAFSRLGHFAARFPAITIVTSVVVVAILSCGWVRFDLEREPARLWVSPTSEAAAEKAFFDQNFGPFYRAEQVFLVNDTLPSGPGPVLSYSTLIWWMGVENSIAELKGATYGTTLNDVCFKPLGDSCVVQSISGYWQGDTNLVSESSWQSYLEGCAKSPVECRPDSGQPIEPDMVLGGHGNKSVVQKAIDFEIALRDRLLEAQKEASERGLRLSFNTEASLEQELNKSTNTDARIILISYLVMFLYASIALGSTTMSMHDLMRNPSIALVQSKFTLGVMGIVIVLMSITASIGLFSWFGLKATLIIAEVIPFIVLAVGVDNIFLIVHEFERVNISHVDDMVEARVSKALGRMGPSILFSALTETVSFALGAFAGMPAVRNFAIYAAGAVFINAVLQVTLFVSILALNQLRVEDHRADCMPCIQIKAARIHSSSANHIAARYYEVPEESLLQQVIRKHYAPALLLRKTKTVVIGVFLAMFATGIALLPEIELGLDQRVAIPDGSYLIPYFNDLYDYFEAGPPVYFVTKEANLSQRAQQQHVCARFTTCDSMSLGNILEGERKRSDVSYLAAPANSWIDDFFLWLNPALGDSCCVNSDTGDACFAGHNPPWNVTMEGLPEGQEFVDYLQRFLAAPTTEDCPLGGRASYGSAVVIDSKTEVVKASHFRTMHTPLRSQQDFISAYAAARRVAKDISRETGLEVFPYSVFYIFFDQYASIVTLTAKLLGAAVGLVFVIASVLLGSVVTAAVVSLTVVMSVVDIMGAMALMGVSLNAVSLVNLVICVGISVEFCAHIARAFMFPSLTLMQLAQPRFGTSNAARGNSDGDARAWTALVNVGSSVFSGITVTKLLGVSVLAFTRSKIFDIYYFRVWLALVVFAALHALVFLPVALSMAGGEGYVDPESEGGIEDDLAARRFRALERDDDSDYDSEDDY
ncbi:NPC intracellular cholesterol transporter 1-related protein 1 [Ceratocystis lukuohia]|uniref:NPC intracellular cholesterol transporter 1-related protein 1 n=1 Tax=Ceratocystis lukuohia TaxID=2019550 RepID=A0ABR4MPQ0_9PEZI